MRPLIAALLLVATTAAAGPIYGLQPEKMECTLAPTEDLAAIIDMAKQIAGPCRIHDAGTVILIECQRSGFLFTRTLKTCQDIVKYRRKYPGTAPTTTTLPRRPRESV